MAKFLPLGGLTFAEILHTHMFMLKLCVTSIYILTCLCLHFTLHRVTYTHVYAYIVRYIDLPTHMFMLTLYVTSIYILTCLCLHRTLHQFTYTRVYAYIVRYIDLHTHMFMLTLYVT
jgi:hypothetical protein